MSRALIGFLILMSLTPAPPSPAAAPGPLPPRPKAEAHNSPLSNFSPSPLSPLTLSVGTSRSVHLPGIARAAIASERTAKVRALPPATLLVTGMRPGATTLRAWTASGREVAFDVRVRAGQSTAAESPVVKIALEFLEVDAAVSEAVGVRWPDTLQFAVGAGLAGDRATSGLNYTATFSSAKGFLQYLTRNGWAKVLAKPDLYVRLGEEATFHSGGEFPVAVTASSYGHHHRQVQWKPFGLSVKVRPQSEDLLEIGSDIDVEVSEMNPSAGMDGIPSLTKRHLDTKMSSRDGETVVLSGLVRQTVAVEKEGVPFLSSIPLLGSLFSHKRETSDANELFMAVTLSFTTRRATASRVDDARSRFDRAEPPG